MRDSFHANFILLKTSLSNSVFGIRDKLSKKILFVANIISNNKTPETIILMPFKFIIIKTIRINNEISAKLKLKSKAARI